ncbi:hypothetical protein, partial [Rhizobium laguerreae]|uniref:hypothetical protein n=1 Tax=Rhizobium laguerreae TaxID=1076926 RepID=UPI001C920E5D
SADHLRSDEHNRHRRLQTFQARRDSDVYCALKPIGPQGRCRFCRRTLVYLTDFFQVVYSPEAFIPTKGTLDGEVFPAG